MSKPSQAYSVVKFRGGFAIAYPDTQTGRRCRNALRAVGHAAALAEAARVWLAMKVGHGDTVGAFVESWLATHSSLHAHARNKDAWKAAKDYWAPLRAGHITEAVCRSYAKHRSRAARTVRYEIEIVRRACYAAKGRQFI